MDRQYMCHCCARCFRTADDLLAHIQRYQSLLLQNVQALRRMPRPSISDVLEILLQHATHADETDQEQKSRCPEPRCTYVSAEGYQALQRHYLRHVACVFECPFCSKPLKTVSGVARHPDACKDRNGRSIPGDSKMRRVAVVREAHAKLRLAQHGKRFSRGNPCPKPTAHRRRSLGLFDRDSDYLTDVPLSNTDIGYSTAVISGTERHINSLAPSGPVSTTTLSSDSTYNTAGNRFSEIDNTPLHIVSNSAYTISPAVPLQEPGPVSMMFGAQTHQAGFSANSAVIQRALSLSHPADGIADFDTEQYTEGADPSYQSGSYVDGHAGRALGLSYTMDGAAIATAQYSSVPGLDAAYQPGVFPADDDTYRALGLTYTADGTSYHSNPQPLFTSEMSDNSRLPTGLSHD